jgi:integrase/recombinase XerD
MDSPTVDSHSQTDQTRVLTVVNQLPPADRGPIAIRIIEAYQSWLVKSPSPDTRSNYSRDLGQFLVFFGCRADEVERLADVRPHHVAAWRDQLLAAGLANSSVVRKLTVLRSLFSFLQTYGYVGANPAHSDYVSAPAVPRDGKTVGLTPEDCRRLLDAPTNETPLDVRDRAMLAVLAYTGCRVGELSRLRVGDYLQTGGHRVLNIRGKGGKERRVPLHPEAVERLEDWIALLAETSGPLFRPPLVSRNRGRDGFAPVALSRRAVQKLVKLYALRLKLDPHVTVHSFRVTALTTARERGSDIIDLQDFAGHADPRTTLTYIRSRDRLSKSPAYVLRY